MRIGLSTRLGLAILLAGVLACDAHPHPTRPSRPQPPQAPEHDESERAHVPTSAWPTDLESLKDDVEREETDQQCRERIRNHMPSAVAEGIADFGYDSFVDELCMSMRALRDRSAETCDALTVSTAQRGCRLRLALLTGVPDVCPNDPVAPGRDPVCLAWAMRDRGMCIGADPRDAVRCRAVLDNRAALCDDAPPTERNRCHAEVARYASALPPARSQSNVDRIHTEMHVDLTWLESTSPPRVLDRNVLDRGIALHVCPDGTRFTLHEPVRVDIHTASALSTSPVVSLSLLVPELESEPMNVVVDTNSAVFHLAIPREGDASSLIDGRGSVHLDATRAERGAPISGNFDIEVSLSPARIRARGRFRTFVRDIITRDDEACSMQLDAVP
ncbi:MAG: hypothetical protein IPK60_10595 [Sandaracinaceae bacterium]|nr:hypothetical protein [Sandaracinaceae bacterium]